MDLSLESYDDYLQIGDCMVDQPTMRWERDVNDVIKGVGFSPTRVHEAAPGGVFDSPLNNTGTDFFDIQDLESLLEGQGGVSLEQPLKVEDMAWLDTCHDMSSLAAYDTTSTSVKGVSYPCSPDSGIGSDGGVSSPVSVGFSSLDAASSPESTGFSSFGPSSPASTVSVEAVASPDVQTFSVSPEGVLDIDILSPVSAISFEMVQNPDVPTFTVSPEDVALLESLWQEDAVQLESSTVSPTGPESLLTTVTLDPISFPAKAIISSPKGHKSTSKVITAQEKKQRKRKQNKNAATRYREKKRAEAQVIYEDQTKLEEKNKSLKDKLTLISREIQYMKELLVEVYRAKGLVE